KQRVFLELHRHSQIAQISPSVIPSEAEESPCFSNRIKLRDASTSLSMTSMKVRFFSILSVSMLVSALAIAQQMPQSLADAELPSLLAIYKDIHSHPELSGHEERTSALIAKELRAAGCEITDHFGKYDNPNLQGYGVIGIMKNG